MILNLLADFFHKVVIFVSQVPANVAGVFSSILPVSAVVLSYLILREPFLWSHLGGVLCILLATSLITIDSHETNG